MENSSIPFEGMETVSCQDCGFEITFTDKQVAAVCPMCASTQIAVAKQKNGIPPEGIIPFKITRNEAHQLFRNWVKSRWFAPPSFKNRITIRLPCVDAHRYHIFQMLKYESQFKKEQSS